jgi:hypothetical protein
MTICFSPFSPFPQLLEEVIDQLELECLPVAVVRRQAENAHPLKLERHAARIAEVSTIGS